VRTFPGALLLVSLAAGTTPVSAQYLNRAVWLGPDAEGMRRDYPQGDDYFVNRAAIADLPPWWTGASWDPFGNRLFVAGGSVSTDRLTLEGVGNVGLDLGSGFTGRLHYLQSEDQTTQYQRVALGIDAPLSERSALFLQLEGTPDKSRSDLSLGFELRPTERTRHRAMLTLVDFSWRKSEELEYTEAPYALGFSGITGDPARAQLYYELGLQLPFEERRLGSDEVFRLERAIGTVETRVALSARDRLVLALDGGLGSKGLRPDDPVTLAREEAEVRHHRLRAEWWRSLDRGREVRLGASWRRLRADDSFAEEPARDLHERREETLLYGAGRLPIAGKWSAEPYVIGGPVRLEVRHGDGTTSGDPDGFQGKLGVPLVFAFSERARLRIDLSLDLDALAFGGGAVQLSASF